MVGAERALGLTFERSYRGGFERQARAPFQLHWTRSQKTLPRADEVGKLQSHETPLLARLHVLEPFQRATPQALGAALIV